MEWPEQEGDRRHEDMSQSFDRMGDDDPANPRIDVDPDAVERREEAKRERSHENGEQSHRDSSDAAPDVPSVGSARAHGLPRRWSAVVPHMHPGVSPLCPAGSRQCGLSSSHRLVGQRREVTFG